METFVIFINDAEFAKRQLVAFVEGRAPERWVLVGCPPRLPRHSGRFLSQPALKRWRADWTREATQEITDLLAGTIQVAFLDVVSPLPHIASGKLTALGISGSHRGPALPNVPTLTEQGFKFDSDGWFGVFAPAGTPAAIVNRLNQEIGKAMAMEEGRQKFTQANMALPAFKNPAQFGATVKADMALWQGLAKQAQLKID